MDRDFLKQSNTLGNLKFQSFRANTVCKGSKNRVGPLFKIDGGHVTVVFEILQKVTVRKKLTSSNFKDIYIG